MVELICIGVNQQLTLQLDYHNCLEDVSKFLIDQKIIHKNAGIGYLLPNNPIPINSLWTLKQIL